MAILSPDLALKTIIVRLGHTFNIIIVPRVRRTTVTPHGGWVLEAKSPLPLGNVLNENLFIQNAAII